MNARQRSFCNYYIELGNATQAAIKAGYSEKTAKSIGQENLTKPDLKQFIDEQLTAIESQQIASAAEVMKYLTSILRGEQSEEVPLLCGEGCQELVHKEISAKDKLKAAELLGKRYGIFTDKLNLEGALTVVIVDDLDEDDSDD